MSLGTRASSGMVHWGRAVQLQLDRVSEARDQQRENNSHTVAALSTSKEGEQLPPEPFPNAHHRLHVDTHFLVLAVRSVLRWHDAIAKQLDDKRLNEAREEFMRRSPDAKDFRDFYEHLDEYVQGEGRDKRIEGPAAPILNMRWANDQLVIRFGELQLDAIEAAEAAIELARRTAAVWFEAVNPEGAAKNPLTF